MYSVNDTVMYSSYGVCMISAIEERDFSGEKLEYYVLRPVGDSKNTFYVPVKNEKLTAQMRKVITKDEIDSLLRIMPDDNDIWIEDENQRREEYRRIIREGDRKELVMLIKTLYLYQKSRRDQRKKLHSADEHFLKDAESMLYDEFAFVLGIEKDKVVDYIREHI